MNKEDVCTLEVGKYVFINELSKKYKGKEARILKLGPVSTHGHCKVVLMIDDVEYMLSSRALYYPHSLPWAEFVEVCKEYDETMASKRNKEDLIYRPRSLRYLLD